MSEPLPKNVAAEVDAKSYDLITEFRQYRDEIIAENPTMDDERKLFESWAIQKIAGLQCVVLNLEARVRGLESGKRSRRPRRFPRR